MTDLDFLCDLNVCTLPYMTSTLVVVPYNYYQFNRTSVSLYNIKHQCSIIVFYNKYKRNLHIKGTETTLCIAPCASLTFYAPT